MGRPAQILVVSRRLRCRRRSRTLLQTGHAGSPELGPHDYHALLTRIDPAFAGVSRRNRRAHERNPQGRHFLRIRILAYRYGIDTGRIAHPACSLPLEKGYPRGPQS